MVNERDADVTVKVRTGNVGRWSVLQSEHSSCPGTEPVGLALLQALCETSPSRLRKQQFPRGSASLRSMVSSLLTYDAAPSGRDYFVYYYKVKSSRHSSEF